MASDKDGKIEKARQLAESGKFVSAISAWRELLDETPHNDANVYNTIGDLCLKNKATADAIDAYGKAARFYLQEGFHLKAIALYKKILKLDPNRAEIFTLLGDLNVVRGLMNNAVADYLSGAKLYLKIGKAMNALTLFRKITKVDPQNTDMRLRVAELCLKEKLTEEAVEEYLRIGREYQRLGRTEDAGKLYEQILKISPGQAEARRRLDNPSESVADVPEPVASAAEALAVTDTLQSAVALETPAAPEPAAAAAGPPPTLEEARQAFAAGNVGEAERMTRLLLLEDPDRNEYQAMLGMIYLKKGHTSIAYDILYPLAKSWLEEGRQAEAVEIVEAFLAAEPDDADFRALKAQASGAPAEAPVETAAASPGGLGGSIEFDASSVSFESQAPSPAQAAPLPEIEAPAREAEPVALDLDVDLDVVAQGLAVVPEETPAEVTAASVVADSSLQAMGADVEAIFEKFRQGVKEQVGDEEFETHYDLGVAYKEMGLVAEAIEEFHLAARGPTRFVDACTMIAACYKDQKLNPSAIAFLERVLADSGVRAPGAPYVKYDLAVLYEEGGFADKAVRLYEEIPSVRDVEARLRRLQGGEEPTARPPAGTKPPVSYL